MGKIPEDRYLVPGLRRGLDLLALFGPARPRLTQVEMAAALGVTRSAIFRVVYTLTELGFLLHDPASGRYAPGPSLLRLGLGALPGGALLPVAAPLLAALSEATGWSAHLGVLDGAEVVYLLRQPAPGALPGIVHAGSRLPAFSTAMGRVLLAHLDEARLVALLREARPSGAPAAGLLLRRARADRARGHVLHLGEFEAGMASVAAPLRDATGQVAAAINLSRRLAEAPEASQRAAREALLRAAATISRRLGCNG